MLTTEHIVTFSIAIATALAVAAIYSRLHIGNLDYRESHLEIEVKDLRRTIDDQAKRLSNQQNEIALLHRLLGEAQLRINYLETEANFHKRRADELEARAIANNRSHQE